jgi:hypothetical protein
VVPRDGRFVRLVSWKVLYPHLAMTTKGSEPIQIVKHYCGIVLHRYQKIYIYGKVKTPLFSFNQVNERPSRFAQITIWLLMLFYICTGAFIVVVTPNRIAQYLYDCARSLALARFGWLALGGAIGAFRPAQN